MNKEQQNPWIEGGKTLALSLVLALGIRSFIAEARYIPSESMLPTLEINDRLIIEKVSYHFKTPKRGEIIVFTPPNTAKQCTPQRFAIDDNTPIKDAYIKRVIGLPGEEIRIENGVVFVNNQALSENYINNEPDYNFGPVVVPESEYLVLGDNRMASCDSHIWGSVPQENIIGRAVVRFWPLNRLDATLK
ncbi:MAG: signal peptidase I [Jaaginema sp. PMC 1080.18]|nr:signal peptidase I [Jaaginema sp. PMC 1080.18]MEC4865717.1 signal peptidase I [Jaaginema sp. PMC 1078.18]